MNKFLIPIISLSVIVGGEYFMWKAIQLLLGDRAKAIKWTYWLLNISLYIVLFSYRFLGQKYFPKEVISLLAGFFVMLLLVKVVVMLVFLVHDFFQLTSFGIKKATATPLPSEGAITRSAFLAGDRKMSIEPSEKFEIDCVIDFPHPFINRQTYNFVFEDGSFGKQIASERTFGFTHEIDMLRKANLALGGSLDNAIVLTDSGMLNETPLRFTDEFVRHKILDIIGDLALIGMPIAGRVTAEKSGHSVHASLMSKLLKAEHAWEIV